MGKKSLTKSTSKKKNTKKKSASSKTETQKTKSQKSAPKKSSGSKKPALKSLRKKNFGSWQPEKPFAPEKDKAEQEAFSAPPLSDDSHKDEFRKLLFRQFDLAEPATETEKTETTAQTRPPEKESAEKEVQKEKEPPKSEEKPAQEEKEEKPPEEQVIEEKAPEETMPAKPEKKEEVPKEPAAEEKEAETGKPEQAETEAESEKKPEPVKKAKEPEKAEPEKKPSPEKAAPEKEAAEEKKKAPAWQGPEASPLAAAKPGKSKEPPAKTPGGGGGAAPPPPSGPGEPPQEPLGRGAKIAIACAAALFACLILASAINSSKYYIKSDKNGVEIWKGSFSPKGRKKIADLEGVSVPESSSGKVSKEKACTVPFEYHMDKADKLAGKPGVPDFSAIRKNLRKADKFAVSKKQALRVKNRLNHIDFTLLLNKADMAADRETPKGYEEALEYLENAKDLANRPSERELAASRIQDIKRALQEFRGRRNIKQGSPAGQAEQGGKTEKTGKAGQQQGQK